VDVQLLEIEVEVEEDTGQQMDRDGLSYCYESTFISFKLKRWREREWEKGIKGKQKAINFISIRFSSVIFRTIFFIFFLEKVSAFSWRYNNLIIYRDIQSQT